VKSGAMAPIWTDMILTSLFWFCRAQAKRVAGPYIRQIKKR
jgi:hypothetical protein